MPQVSHNFGISVILSDLNSDDESTQRYLSRICELNIFIFLEFPSTNHLPSVPFTVSSQTRLTGTISTNDKFKPISPPIINRSSILLNDKVGDVALNTMQRIFSKTNKNSNDLLDVTVSTSKENQMDNISANISKPLSNYRNICLDNGDKLMPPKILSNFILPSDSTYNLSINTDRRTIVNNNQVSLVISPTSSCSNCSQSAPAILNPINKINSINISSQSMAGIEGDDNLKANSSQPTTLVKRKINLVNNFVLVSEEFE